MKAGVRWPLGTVTPSDVMKAMAPEFKRRGGVCLGVRTTRTHDMIFHDGKEGEGLLEIQMVEEKLVRSFGIQPERIVCSDNGGDFIPQHEFFTAVSDRISEMPQRYDR